MKLRFCIIACISLMLFSCNTSNDLFVEAESFTNKGGWVLDQQFMDLMGSPYLMAHGIGIPVEDASKEVTFPSTGTYHVYVRTFNWTSPWHEGEGPGKFKLAVGETILPTELGASGKEWYWQKAGSVDVKDRKQTLWLHDLTGFNGRCDAIYFTKNENQLPPSDIEELHAFRKEKLNIPEAPTIVKEYDFVVIGGGVAGICAATAAARNGSRVALINDRPILGGNNSSEIRVHLGGDIEVGPYPNLGNLLKEFGHTRYGNARPAEYYEDEKKMNFIESEENVTLYSNNRAIAVTMKGDEIESVVAKNIETGEEIRFKAPIFADCTGDGTIGYLAGADFLMGREGRDEFGEEIAPEKADKMTMGVSIQWYSYRLDENPNPDKKVSADFPLFQYGITFTDESCEKVVMGEWTWETGMNMDQIFEAETIRDYGMLVVYSNWSYLKNELKDNEKYHNRYLEWVAYVAGKRESRRLLGDYILKEDDITKHVFHEDWTAATSWSIDLHFPDRRNSELFPGREFLADTEHIRTYPYPIPYRCYYSRNVNNLFMAGRNISTTHVALGTTRVMRTTGMMGEVVGMAASLCNKYNTKPRQIYFYHLDELKEMMKQGAGKQGLPNNQKFNNSNLLDKPQKVN